ncbi:protein of unknown function DUF83 [Anaerovirgula multivorans]|uniref:DUF83 domain-containing protein n=1 Tax=Anaerovirgula multivorans TaxID=312168 RepID=A0A239CP35_9FIRM|nr:Dna2/Cas4 domain-containing protein [Anaerovirgula multivorans]SNS21093.1 protein of unknown function DUF83 [Anaerovirgula multivorans]
MGLRNLAKQIKQKEKEASVTIEEKFIKAIDGFLLTSPKKPRVDRLAFKPSQYYKCKRQTYYFLGGEKGIKKKYPRSERILQVGTALHEWVQEDVFMSMKELMGGELEVELLPKEELPNFGKEGLEFLKQSDAPDMEIKFLDHSYTEKFPISGMVDGWMEFDNISFLFEFKTINSKDFSLLIEPLKDHVKQGALYCLSLGVKRVMFLYLCKDTQNLKAYLVTYTDEQIEWVRKHIVGIEKAIDSKELPDKEVNQSCRFCQYKHLCDVDKSVELKP